MFEEKCTPDQRISEYLFRTVRFQNFNHHYKWDNVYLNNIARIDYVHWRVSSIVTAWVTIYNCPLPKWDFQIWDGMFQCLILYMWRQMISTKCIFQTKVYRTQGDTNMSFPSVLLPVQTKCGLMPALHVVCHLYFN